MRTQCPDSGIIAAFAEGHLPEAEAESLLDHAAECDECRAEIALTGLIEERESEPVQMSQQLKETVLESVERQRGTRRSSARHYMLRRTSLSGPLSMAAVALAAVLLTAIYFKMQPAQPETRPVADRPDRTSKVVEPKVEAPVMSEPQATEPIDTREPKSSTPEMCPEEEPLEVPPPHIDPPKEPVAPPKDPLPTDSTPHETVVRTLASVTVSDFIGDVTIKRRGSSVKEKAGGVISVGDGDLLTTDKAAAFFLLGHYAIALGPQSQVTLARFQENETPSLTVYSGEAMVDSGSTGGAAWSVGNTSMTLSIDRTRGQFAVATEEKGIALCALSGPLSGRDAAGRTFEMVQGDRLFMTAERSDKKSDLAGAQKKRAFLSSTKPKERTVLFVSFDGSSLKSISIGAGDILKEKSSRGTNELLRSVDRKDSHAATVKFVEGIRFSKDLMLRVRVRTNLTTVRMGLGIEEKGTLFNDLRVDRKQLGTWVTLDMPLDEGFLDRPFIISSADRFMNLTVSGKQQDMFGDGRGYILVDDVQIFEPNP